MLYINKRYLFLVCLSVFFVGCSPISDIKKSAPRANVAYLPSEARDRLQLHPKDTVKKVDPIISFMGKDSTMVYLVPVAKSADGNMASVNIEAVTITGQKTRQVAERNGKINIDFVVAVPKEMQRTAWQVNVYPFLQREQTTPDSLEAIQLSGTMFRKWQHSDYQRYERYLGRIIPDSADFFRSYVNEKRFYKYLNRMAQQRQRLLMQIKNPGRRTDEVLMQRFEIFNDKEWELDQWREKRFDRQDARILWRKQTSAQKGVALLNPRTKVTSPSIALRFSLFNAKMKMNKADYLQKQQARMVASVDDIPLASRLYFRRARLEPRDTTNILAQRFSLFNEQTERAKTNYITTLQLRHQAELNRMRYESALPREIKYPSRLLFTRVMPSVPRVNAPWLAMRFSLFNAKLRYIKSDYIARRKPNISADEVILPARYFTRQTPPMFKAPSPELTDRFSFFNQRAEIARNNYADRRQVRTEEFLYREIVVPSRYVIRTAPVIVPDSSKLLVDRFAFFNSKLPDAKANYIERHRGMVFTSVDDIPVPSRFRERQIPPATYLREPSGYDRMRARAAMRHADQADFDGRGKLGLWLPRASLSTRDIPSLAQRTKQYNDRRREIITAQLNDIIAQDSANVVQKFIEHRKIALNKKMKLEKDVVRDRMIPVPLRDGLRLDTVLVSRDTLYYKYSQQVTADENTAKLYVYLNGDMTRRSGVFYNLPQSDTLTFNVSSMVNFIDETPRYIQRVISRDAEASSSFFIAFARNKSTLNENYSNNSTELKKVKDMIAKLINDPIYIIDSISICAYSSPEGNYNINKRFAEERSQAFGAFMSRELKVWSDSLNISETMTLDDQGRTVRVQNEQQSYPDLSKSVKIKSVAENWDMLSNLIRDDEKVKNRVGILDKITTIANPDTREYSIRRNYPADYNYIRDKHYDKLRVVDVSFNLHRRGMVKDTVHTTELDSAYMEGLRLLKTRKYQQALDILRPYDNVNTAIAYMSLGYDDAALRIFSQLKPTADIIYTMAILYARKDDPSKAVENLMRAVEMNSRLRFRANLDPELSILVKKYNLFSDD